MPNVTKLLSTKREEGVHSSIIQNSQLKQLFNEVDEPRAYYTGWSKSEREKQTSYTNIYIWNLEKQYWKVVAEW